MAKYKVVFLGPEDDKLEYEQAEMADLDVEFVKANPKSEGEAMEVVKDADAILNRAGWGSEQFIKSTKNCKVLANLRLYLNRLYHLDSSAVVLQYRLVQKEYHHLDRLKDFVLSFLQFHHQGFL